MKPPHSRFAGPGIALLLSIATTQSFCQTITPPGQTALSGSTIARTDQPSFIVSNPASLRSIDSGRLYVSFAPSNLGIERYHEGELVGALPIDSVWRCAVSIQGLGNGVYEEVTLSAAVAWSTGEAIDGGITVSLHSVSITRYGSGLAGSIDAGIIVHPSPVIRFGASVRNLTRSTLADVDLPQRIATGFAVDLASGTTLSIDLAHELRRPVSVALGLSVVPIERLTIRGGVGHSPASISLGIGYDPGTFSFDYGGAYIAPLGIRQSFGIGLHW